MNKLTLSLLTLFFGAVYAEYTVRIVTEGNLVKRNDSATLGNLRKDLKKVIEKHVPKRSPVTVEFTPIFKDTKVLLKDLYVKRDPKTGKVILDPSGKPKEESGFDVDYKDTQKVTEAGGNPTYGEATAHAVDAVFDTVGVTPNSALIDIGCGVGKLLLQAFIEHPNFVEVVGYDLCKGRIDKAQLAKKRLLEMVKAEEDNLDPEIVKSILDSKRKVEFNLHDAQKIDWSRYTKYVTKGGKVISWICATCFSPLMMKKLASNYVKFAQDVISKSNGEVAGDIVIFTLKEFFQDKTEFPEDRAEFEKYFDKEETVNLDMTWSSGVAVYKYVLKKRNFNK